MSATGTASQSSGGGSQAAIPPPRMASPRFSLAAYERLAERCRTLGLSVWRCDNAGLIVREPEEPGAVGLLLRSDPIMSRVSGVAREWGRAATPQVKELFTGCWAMPIEETHRRRRTGMIVIVALGPEAVRSEGLEQACRAAQLDSAALRRLLAARAIYSAESCRSVRESLLWMMQDLTTIAEHEQTTAGFTEQLTDSYETIDLLYGLGRSMKDLGRPERFVEHLCERLRFALGFGWVGVWLEDDTSVGQGATFIAGNAGAEPEPLMASVRRAGAADGSGERMILTDLEGVVIGGAGQVLVQPVTRSGRTIAIIAAGDKDGVDPQVSSYDMQLLEAAGGFIGAFLDNAALYAEQEAMFLGTLEALTAAIDAKDRYTCGHSQRVAYLSQQLALAAGLSIEQAERVRIAGLVHDVGKIGVPEAVLCKQGKLTDDEFDAIKKHPEIGYRILKDIPRLGDVLPGVLHHHERIDGRGYPHRLKGEDIPMLGRLIAIADTFDAMSSTRSYRSALPRTAVLAEIRKCAGMQFDPRLAGLFVKLDFSEYDRMAALHAAAGGESPMRAAAA